MPADEKVQRVMQRIGKWSPIPVSHSWTMRLGNWYCDACNSICRYYEDHKCKEPLPDPSDPAIIVAMLEWCGKNLTEISVLHGDRTNKWFVDLNFRGRFPRGDGEALSAALIDTIDSLPED